MVRKIGPENISDMEKYYNDCDEGAQKRVLKYQIDMINNCWKSMISYILELKHIQNVRYTYKPIIEPLINIKGDEEE